jgi:hypothetical protein
MSISLPTMVVAPRRRLKHLLLNVCCSLLLVLPTLAQSCEPRGLPILELRVTPGEMAAAGKVLRIAVHDNDCVHIRMPDYYRRRGEYVLSLDSITRNRIENLQRDLHMQPYEQQRMLSEAAAIETQRSEGLAAERFKVLDADHYELSQRGDSFGMTTTRALAIFQYAERYPEIRSLDALQRLAKELIALTDSTELLAHDETARISGAGQ